MTAIRVEVTAEHIAAAGDDRMAWAQPVEAAIDRHQLLDYIDELDRQITGIGESISRILANSRLVLGLRLLEDGHAKNLGEAITIAEDLDKVAEFYPWVED